MAHANSSREPLALDLESYEVISQVNAQPVAMLNEASSMLERIQYCRSVLGNLEMISTVCKLHETLEVSLLATVFSNHLVPLEKLLDRMLLDAQAGGMSNSRNVAGRV